MKKFGHEAKEGNLVKKNIILSLLLLSLIMLSVTALPASATDYTKVGVKVGDTAYYSYSNPQRNGTLQIYVQQIAGTNVTLNIKDMDSVRTDTSNNNIVTGNLSATITNKIFVYLVASNLSQGDSVTPGSTCTIDKTTTMIIAGLNRTVNHVSYSLTLINPSGSYYFDAYWDKVTGLSIKSNVTILGWQATSAGVPAGSYIMNLKSTTAFGNNIDPIALLVTAGGVTVLLVAVAIAAFTQKKQKATTSEKPTTLTNTHHQSPHPYSLGTSHSPDSTAPTFPQP